MIRHYFSVITRKMSHSLCRIMRQKPNTVIQWTRVVIVMLLQTHTASRPRTLECKEPNRSSRNPPAFVATLPAKRKTTTSKADFNHYFIHNISLKKSVKNPQYLMEEKWEKSTISHGRKSVKNPQYPMEEKWEKSTISRWKKSDIVRSEQSDVRAQSFSDSINQSIISRDVCGKKTS